MIDADVPDEEKDMSHLLNALNSGVDPFAKPIRHKRKLLPHPEVEKDACNELKRIKLVFPAGKKQSPEPSGLMVSDTGEIIPQGFWVDTVNMGNELGKFMKRHKVTQTQLARYFGVSQMWLSRMLCAPRKYELLQDMGRVHCRKINHWLKLPEEKRLQELCMEKKIYQVEQEPEKVMEFDDDGQPVDTYAMIGQMKEEMKIYRVTVSDYSRGSGVKYSWVYTLVRTPNFYDSFNSSGKRQARLLHKYLNLPLNERKEMWKFKKELRDEEQVSLNTEQMVALIKEKLESENITAQLLCTKLHIDYDRFKYLFAYPIPWENLNIPLRRMLIKLNDWRYSPDFVGSRNQSCGVAASMKEEELTDEMEEIVTLSPEHTSHEASGWPEIDTATLIRQVNKEMKLLKLSSLQLGDHLNIRNLRDLLQTVLKWDKYDDDLKEEYHILQKWMKSHPDKRIMEAQIIQGTFDPNSNFGRKLLARRIEREGEGVMAELEEYIKTEPLNGSEICFRSLLNSHTRSQIKSDEEPSTSAISLSSKVTVNLCTKGDLVRVAVSLIEQKMEFSVGLSSISIVVRGDEVRRWLSFYTDHGFTNVDACMTQSELPQADEINDKIRKQIRNDGTFGNLIKRAIAELEEDGFLDDLREDGKRHSDDIFRQYFPNDNRIVDMNKDLKEKIMFETKKYATRQDLQDIITKTVDSKFQLDWFLAQKYIMHKIEDMVRKAIGLPPLYEIKQEIKEELESEGTLMNTASAASELGPSDPMNAEYTAVLEEAYTIGYQESHYLRDEASSEPFATIEEEPFIHQDDHVGITPEMLTMDANEAEDTRSTDSDESSSSDSDVTTDSSSSSSSNSSQESPDDSNDASKRASSRKRKHSESGPESPSIHM